MSSDLTSLIWRNPNLKGNRKLVMLAFADYAGATGRIFPSINHLILKTGLAEKTVRGAIDDCIEASYLAKKEQFKQTKTGITQTSNAYKINYKKLIAEANPVEEPVPGDWSTDVFHDGTPCVGESTPPSKVTTPPLVKLLPPLPQTYQGNSSLNSSSKKTTDARAPASLNTISQDTAEAFVAAVVEGIEKKEGKGQFEYVPEHDDLIMGLGRIDISYQRATLLLRQKGTRRIREVLNCTLDKAKTNPAAYFERMIVNDWTPAKAKEAKEEAPRVNTIELETRKRIEAENARIEAIRGSTAIVEAQSSAMDIIRASLGRKARKNTEPTMTTH